METSPRQLTALYAKKSFPSSDDDPFPLAGCAACNVPLSGELTRNGTQFCRASLFGLLRSSAALGSFSVSPAV